MKIIHKNYHFTAVIEHDEDGYFAKVPGLQGCHAQGDTHEEIVANINEVVKMIVEYMIECGEEIPQSNSIEVLELDVAV